MLALLLYLQLHALDVVQHVGGVFVAPSNNVAPNEKKFLVIISSFV